MDVFVVRRLSVATAVVALLVAAPAAAQPAAPAPKSWAYAEIKLVVARGILASDLARFRPDDALTEGELAEVVAALREEPAVDAANPSATVSLARLDAALVRAVGLGDAAYRFYLGARRAGLTPPSRFGTEVAARLLGLRTNHPQGEDARELAPTAPATRAEAAYSVAKILRFRGWEVQSVKDNAASFALPTLTPWQRRILATGFGLVGNPYVWGGMSERPQTLFGAPAPGGFDCSGFVWRVYKLQAYAGGAALAPMLRGRTTMTMSVEVPQKQRIPFAELAPGDIVFFGAKGPRSKGAEIDHAGIYAGNGWIVHSSSAGTTLAPLTGWYRERFAWARRPLAEAGLA